MYAAQSGNRELSAHGRSGMEMGRGLLAEYWILDWCTTSDFIPLSSKSVKFSVLRVNVCS
jgi:hypothetical protein